MFDTAISVPINKQAESRSNYSVRKVTVFYTKQKEDLALRALHSVRLRGLFVKFEETKIPLESIKQFPICTER